MSDDEQPIAKPIVEEDEEEEEEEYSVEKIVNKRTKNKKTEYFIKWEGFPDEDNTWEPAENLNCPELISEFESAHAKKGKQKATKEVPKDTTKAAAGGAKRKADDAEEAPQTKTKKLNAKGANGFDRGMEAEEILGATETNGEVYFLIRWKDCMDAELVPAKVANIKVPQMVIKFYETRLTWSQTKDAPVTAAATAAF